MINGYVSTRDQLVLYLAVGAVGALMVLVPGDGTLIMGAVLTLVLVGAAAVDTYRRRRWPQRVEALLSDVLAHVEELSPDEVTVSVVDARHPEVRSIRDDDGRRRVVVSQGMRVLYRDANALWFILAHEVAHQVLGHLDAGVIEGFGDEAESYHAVEFAADAWAMALAQTAGRDPRSGIRSLRVLDPIESHLLGGRPRPKTHPTAAARIERMRAQLPPG